MELQILMMGITEMNEVTNVFEVGWEETVEEKLRAKAHLDRRYACFY